MPHDAMKTPGPGAHQPEQALRAMRLATTASVLVATILVLAKLWAYALSHSVAMLASFADSALDLAASMTTFYAVRYAAVPADREHRYGHGKAESFASLFQALLVAISAALVARESMARLFSPRVVEHGGLAMGVMVLSIVLTVMLVQWQSRAIRQSGSVAITGDRAHYMSDLAANASVIIGLGLTLYLDLGWADGAVGLGIAGWLVWTAWGVARGALDQMLDRELPDEERRKIKKLALEIKGVLSVHELRTRAAGIFVHIQFHVDLDPKISLAEAHKILVRVENRLLEKYPAADILIHPDPKGEAESHGSTHFNAEKH
ncbi:MAG: cation-efflux pump [Robiginitomaculum sp.]|nr:MAG: cation-efflux pump [Robiginitomaculum sp.]